MKRAESGRGPDHLEISNRCQLDCPYCYNQKKTGEELSTEEWKRTIDALARYGVFQVTFGGGEPTLRDDLKDLALHVRRRGLNLSMTTNGLRLPDLEADTLCLFNQINVSCHHAAPIRAFLGARRLKRDKAEHFAFDVDIRRASFL